MCQAPQTRKAAQRQSEHEKVRSRFLESDYGAEASRDAASEKFQQGERKLSYIVVAVGSSKRRLDSTQHY